MLGPSKIEVSVVFDLPVSVTGTPTLALDTGAYASYMRTSEDEMEVRKCLAAVNSFVT